MGLPEWCQTHSFKDFLELIDLGHTDPTRNNNMTDATPEVLPVEMNPFEAAPVKLLPDPVFVQDPVEGVEVK